MVMDSGLVLYGSASHPMDSHVITLHPTADGTVFRADCYCHWFMKGQINPVMEGIKRHYREVDAARRVVHVP